MDIASKMDRFEPQDHCSGPSGAVQGANRQDTLLHHKSTSGREISQKFARLVSCWLNPHEHLVSFSEICRHQLGGRGRGESESGDGGGWDTVAVYVAEGGGGRG